MATIVKTPSGTWKALIRKTGFPTTIKTFRLKRDAEDWARRTEDEIAAPIVFLLSDGASMISGVSLPIDGERWVIAASVPTYNPKSRELETDIGPRLITLVRSVEGVLGTSSLS